jgi:hypothetical protein
MDQIESTIRNKIFSGDAKIGTRRVLPGRSGFTMEFIREDANTVKVIVNAPAKIDTNDLVPKLMQLNFDSCKISVTSADHRHTTFEILTAAEKAPVVKLLNFRTELISTWIQLNCFSTQKLQLSINLELSCNKGQVAVLTRFATQWEAELASTAVAEIATLDSGVFLIETGSLQHKQFFSGREIAGVPVIAAFKLSRNSDSVFFARIAQFSDSLTSQVQMARIAARGIFFGENFDSNQDKIELVRAA